MKKGYPINQGKETWKILEQIRNKGHSYFFRDWLDMILYSLLSLTENLGQIMIKKDLEMANQGAYNAKYMEIVERYQEKEKNAPRGTRTIDLMAQAWGMLYKETLETKKDILGEIYQAQITYGEHGQFFTPEHITDVMTELVGKEKTLSEGVQKGEKVMDPCCGSGRFLLSRAKKHPEDYLIGQDIDERCCKMAAINLWIFDLTGEIRQGDSLAGKIDKRWIIKKGGFIYEDNDPKTITWQKEKQDGVKVDDFKNINTIENHAPRETQARLF